MMDIGLRGAALATSARTGPALLELVREAGCKPEDFPKIMNSALHLERILKLRREAALRKEQPAGA